jgi:predicted GNAT superfamily acetyltransferase
MTGVIEAHRDRKVGGFSNSSSGTKRFHGIRLVEWTFDPLEYATRTFNNLGPLPTRISLIF